MEDNDETMTTKISGVGNLQQEDGTLTGNSISSNLAMVFSKLPELLAQTKHQLDSASTSSNHNMATAAAAAVSTEHYISCIKINGVPILPPVLDENCKKEMRMYREEAVRRSKEREKQKNLASTSELSVPSHSPVGNTSKNDSNDLYDSLESSQQETVLSQALASAISPPNQSTKGDQQVTTTQMPDNLFSIDWKQIDMLTSLSDLGSLDDGSLPTQLHGIPLTSKSEQQITRDLSTLSKHLPESCGSAHSEICDLNLDLNSRLAVLSPAINILNQEKPAFSCSPPPLCLLSSSPLSEPSSDQKPEDESTDIETSSTPLFKAPIFLTEDNGLHLSAKRQSPTSVACSPSLKVSPVVSEQPWIMNSPLIAYVTKKRPKPVGMCSLSVKPDALSKTQRVNNATFTIFRKKQDVQSDIEQNHDEDKPQLKRPVINAEQRSSTPIAEFSNSSSPGEKVSPKELASPTSRKCKTSSKPELSKSPTCQKIPSSKLQTSGLVDRPRYKFSGSQQIKYSKTFGWNGYKNHNNNCKEPDVPKVNLDDAISLTSSSLSTSPRDLSPKEHLGDDSLDELLLGVENIGLVPRIDGDGSDVPSPSSLSKDSPNLPITSLNDQKEVRQAWQKNTAFHSPELVRSNFSPVGTESPHTHLQISVATVDVTNSSGIASLCDMSAADSPVTCLTKQAKISSTVTDASTNNTNSGIRRGSYTLLEPSINLAKLAQLTPSPARNNNNSNISEKIPSYADFETDLHKRIPSKNQSPKSVQPSTATPSKLVTPVKSITAKKPFHSDPKYSVQKKPLKTMSPCVSKAKSVNQIKNTKDSFHLTPQIPKTKNSPKCFQSEKLKKQEKLTAIPQPNVTKKTSPKTFREWRLSNIDTKVSADHLKKDAENMTLKDELSPNASVDSPLLSPSLPSPSLANDSPLDWDNKIEDQMKCFFSEKKHSYFKLKREFTDWQEKMDVAEQNFQKTLESITRSKQVSDNWRQGLDFLTPDISFTSTEHGQMETPIKQLFEQQTPAVSPVSSQASGDVPIDNGTKPIKSKSRGLEIIPAAAKGFLTRKLLACPKVVALRKTIQECDKLLEEIDYNSNIDFINRINNQLESSRQEIYSIFFEKTVQEKMELIRQSRDLPKKTPPKENLAMKGSDGRNKVPQLSHATQKYQMRKKTKKEPVPDKNENAGKVASSLKQSVSSSQSPIKPVSKKEKKETAQTKPENRSVRKIAPPQPQPPPVPKKPNKIVSVAGKMTATRIVATKTIAGPLQNNNKPWR